MGEVLLSGSAEWSDIQEKLLKMFLTQISSLILFRARTTASCQCNNWEEEEEEYAQLGG